MYIKRQTADKKWPIPRKGTKYIVSPDHNRKTAIPLLIILRDMLKVVRTRKEAKYIINNKEVMLNNKVVRKDSVAVILFDILKIKSLNKNYSLVISKKGKFELEEIKESDSNKKICGVLNKKIVKKALNQLNLHDGRNIITKDRIGVGDSIVLDLEKKTIVKHLPLKIGAEILVTSGKHIGEKGKIKEVKEKKCVIEIDSKKINMETKNLVVTGP